MPLYEHVFIARQDISSAQVDTLVQDFTGILEGGGGKVTKTESWGLRNLTYRIKKNRKGHYVLLNIDAPSDAVLELERQERIHDDVLRYLTLRVEEHEEGPSAIIQGRKERGGRDDEDGDGRRPRRDRDDRGDRGDRGERRDRDDRGSREAAPAQTQESE